jgi:sulfur-carrier protein
MIVKILYFAWLRERIGKAEEELEPPPGVTTVGQLMGWLAGRDQDYAAAFANPRVIRAALDRTHVKPEAAITAAREVAFFPPMTGG